MSDSDYRIYSIVSQENSQEGGIYKEDFDILRKRNSSAFGLEKTSSTVGRVWKSPATNLVGNIYRDETYFVFSDYSFLNGVKIGGPNGREFKNGEKLKGYVDGIGLKVRKVDDKWNYKNEWQRERNIEVKRVLMKNGQQFEAGKGTCMLVTNNDQAVNDSGLYLLIGFIKTSGVNKPSKIEFAPRQESFCKHYQDNTYKIGNSQIAISFEVNNGQITGDEYPVLSVINDSEHWIKPIYWKSGAGDEISPVVLALAIKGKQQSEIDKNGWEILDEVKAKKEMNKKINAGEIVERHWRGNRTVGFQLKAKNKLKGDATEDWIAKAKITFT